MRFTPTNAIQVSDLLYLAQEILNRRKREKISFSGTYRKKKKKKVKTAGFPAQYCCVLSLEMVQVPFDPSGQVESAPFSRNGPIPALDRFVLDSLISQFRSIFAQFLSNFCPKTPRIYYLTFSNLTYPAMELWTNFDRILVPLAEFLFL